MFLVCASLYLWGYSYYLSSGKIIFTSYTFPLYFCYCFPIFTYFFFEFIGGLLDRLGKIKFFILDFFINGRQHNYMLFWGDISSHFNEASNNSYLFNDAIMSGLLVMSLKISYLSFLVLMYWKKHVTDAKWLAY